MPTIGRRLVDMLPSRDCSPEAMTPRARAYLAVVTSRHFAVAVIMLGLPHRLPRAPYVAFNAAAPLYVWGVASLVVGAFAFIGGTWRSEWWARVSLISSATLTAAMTTALLMSWSVLTSFGLMAAVLLLAVTSKDMIVCQDPIRSPFEAVLRRKVG